VLGSDKENGPDCPGQGRPIRLVNFAQTAWFARSTIQSGEVGITIKDVQPTECTEAKMSLHELRKAQTSYLPVICWRCDAPMMKIKTIIPAVAEPSLDEVVYSCPACKSERALNILRDN
jgi:Zn finger protein HypA/HybF involved in hydrogenase expression